MMGMNYYAVDIRKVCSHCGRGVERRHIGKSSAGWVFSLHVYPDEGIHTLEDWKQYLSGEGVHIEDEREEVVTLESLLQNITNRQWSNSSKMRLMASNLKENHAVLGPNNLLRSRLDERCVGHGEGPWDYIVGDFS